MPSVSPSVSKHKVHNMRERRGVKERGDREEERERERDRQTDRQTDRDRDR